MIIRRLGFGVSPRRRGSQSLVLVVLASRLPTLLLSALAVALSACGGEATAPGSGRLGVLFDAVPPTGQGAATITGPKGFSRAILASDTLEGLARGAYTIAAVDIVAFGARYSPGPVTQTVEVPASGLASAIPITYRLASARLTVTVLGLPSGTSGGVSITGPNAFSRTLASTTTLDLLEPGIYTMASADVLVSGKTYHASPASQTITLPASTTAQVASVWYGGGTGTLDVQVKGLPEGLPAAVDISGPAGFARTITASATIPYLDDGRYTVAARPVGSNLTTYRPTFGTQSLVVSAGTTTMAEPFTYIGAPLTLGLTPVVSGLNSPLFLTAPEGDSRLFIVERTGRVRLMKDGVLLPTPFLDIANKVNFAGERGLLGMAFDPSYATNGRFYVYYVDLTGGMTLERFGSTPGEDIAGASLGVVMAFPHGGSEHHGGMVAFGPDGMLYFGPGDGGCCGDPNDHAQDLNSLLGKILRIDVRGTSSYSIPTGNPFVGRVGFRPEIWASGLRNPWRFSFDASGGFVYIGDVGQDAREEVNVSPVDEGGRNYGWRRMEGNACYNPSSNCDAGNTLTKPVLDYLHSEGCSVTGGYVYRGSAIPELAGHYLYSDYCRGWLRSFLLVGGVATTRRDWGLALQGTVSFGRDGAGELYMIAQDKVWRIVRL